MKGDRVKNGLLNKDDVIDSLIVDCNMLVKELVDGNYIKFCSNVVEMVSKLANLKKAMHADIDNLQETIQLLKEQLRCVGVPLETVPVEQLMSDQGDTKEA